VHGLHLQRLNYGYLLVSRKRSVQMKTDLIRKLSSRKFWISLIGFVTALHVELNVPDIRIEQVVAVLSALAPLVAYILAEGYADAHRENDYDV
jgi:hypothetical protein